MSPAVGSGTGPGRVPAPVLLVAAAVSLQTGAAVATTLFEDLGATGVLALRIGVGAVCLAVLARVWRTRLPAASWGLVVSFGAVLGTMNLLFYLSLERVPLGVAVALELVGPMGVAVLGSRSRAHLVWVGAAVAGTAVLVLPGALAELGAGAGDGVGSGPGAAAGALDPVGVLLALGAGACWAGYILLGARVGAAAPGSAGLALGMLASCVVLVPLGVTRAGAALLEPHLLLTGVVVGLLSSALPYALELSAIRRVGVRAFGVMMSLEPAVALATGLVVAGQRPAPLALVGVALVVVASLGAVPAAAGGRPGRPGRPASGSQAAG